MSCGRLSPNPRACPPSSPNVSWPREPTVGLDAHLARVRDQTRAAFGSENGQSGEERAYDAQFRARRVAEDLALALQASLLVRHAPAAVAERLLRDPARAPRRSCVRDAAAGCRCPGDHRAGATVITSLETIAYEVTGRVARITLDRPERGNGITRRLVTDLEQCVEDQGLRQRRSCDRPGGQRQGLLRRLRPRRERRGPGRARPRVDRAAPGVAARSARDDGQPRPRRAVGPDDRLRDDEPQRPCVHVAVSLLETGRLQGPRVLRRRRNRHGAVLGSARDRRRRPDRLPARAVWGSPTTSLWAYRLGPQHAKRLLFTGDSLSGAEALEWGLAIDAPARDMLDLRAEVLVERIARYPSTSSR